MNFIYLKNFPGITCEIGNENRAVNIPIRKLYMCETCKSRLNERMKKKHTQKLSKLAYLTLHIFSV